MASFEELSVAIQKGIARKAATPTAEIRYVFGLMGAREQCFLRYPG